MKVWIPGYKGPSMWTVAAYFITGFLLVFLMPTFLSRVGFLVQRYPSLPLPISASAIAAEAIMMFGPMVMWWWLSIVVMVWDSWTVTEAVDVPVPAHTPRGSALKVIGLGLYLAIGLAANVLVRVYRPEWLTLGFLGFFLLTLSGVVMHGLYGRVTALAEAQLPHGKELRRLRYLCMAGILLGLTSYAAMGLYALSMRADPQLAADEVILPSGIKVKVLSVTSSPPPFAIGEEFEWIVISLNTGFLGAGCIFFAFVGYTLARKARKK